MKKVITIFACIGIILLGGAFSLLMYKTKPEAVKKAVEEVLPQVEVASVSPETIEIVIPSQGTIEPRRRTMLAAEVSGKIVKVSPKFDVGGHFEENEILLELDDADYRSNLAQAKAALADAELALSTEKARAEQALRDWKSLGRQGEPNDLTLRKPQLDAAEAKIDSSKENVAKAERDLERTKVRAPFEAVLSKAQTELGSWVAPGAALAEIYTPAPWEIRLPISLDEMRFIKRDRANNPVGEVRLISKAGNETFEWVGEIVRTEGEVERDSRSIYLVAEVPSTTSGGPIDLQPGLFVQAALVGKSVENLIRVPFRAFLDLERVVVVDPNDQLQFRTVEVVRRQADDALISGGLESTDRLILTELSDRIPGMKVDPLPIGTETEKQDGVLTRNVAP